MFSSHLHLGLPSGLLPLGLPARIGSPKTVASKVTNYKLDLMRAPKVRWDKGGNEPVMIIHYSKEMVILIS
jgi:hypothetical protein